MIVHMLFLLLLTDSSQFHNPIFSLRRKYIVVELNRSPLYNASNEQFYVIMKLTHSSEIKHTVFLSGRNHLTATKLKGHVQKVNF